MGLGNGKRKTRRAGSAPCRREIGASGARGFSAIPVATAIAAALAAGATSPALGGNRDAAYADQPRQLAQAAETRRFSVPAQPLAAALEQFAAQAGLSFAYKTGEISGLRSPGVSGEMSVAAALRQLLSGTGIAYQFTDSATVSLTRPVAGTGQVTTMDPIRVEDRAETAFGPVEGYVATRSATGTKTDTPLIEVPQTISVVTRDQLDARDANKMNEALRYTPGVQPEPFGVEPRYTDIRIRGLDVTTTALFRDGMALSNPNYVVSYNLEPWGAERLEVPRGPASVLYGQGNPGGFINYISKRPLNDPHRYVEVETGSPSRAQIKTDFGDALDEARTLTYRLTALGRRADTQFDFIEDDRHYIAPALTWRPLSTTTLTLLASHQQDDTRNSQAYPAVGTQTPNPNGEVPYSRFVGEPDVDQYDRTEYSIGYEFEHVLNDALTLRHNLRYHDVDLNDTVVYTTGLAGDQRSITRAAFDSSGNLEGLTIDNQLQLKLGQGAWKHTLLAGVDFQRADILSIQSTGTAPNLDIFAPTYGGTVTFNSPFKNETTLRTQTGVYLQDQVALGKHWRFTLSGRFDHATADTRNNLTGVETQQRDNAFTYRAGVVYLSDLGLAPYASYSESFLPTSGTDANGNPFDPETGQQYEIGLKYQPPGTESFVTVSLFELRRQNYLESDPVTFQNVQTGEVRSRGVEVEATSRFKFGEDRLDLTAGYTYVDAQVTESANAAEIGKTVRWVPDQIATLWADYTFGAGDLKDFGLGLGVRYRGENYGDTANTISVHGHAVLDASLHYDWNDLRFAVHATNLLDEKYLAACYPSATTICTVGERLTVKASVGFRW